MAQINNAIVLVDDDKDDQELFAAACHELGVANELIILSSPSELLSYLSSDIQVPFFILCDYNLPGQSGFDLWSNVKKNEELKFKSIPFLLWSTVVSERQLREAYNSLVQGFFLKPTEYKEIVETLKAIITYWTYSRHPKQLR